MMAARMQSESPEMMAEPSKKKKEVILPVTRLVSTLSMSIVAGQLVAVPLLKAA